MLESTRADHRAQGDELLTALLPHTGKSFRLGIRGVPGVGKSTFIETLGLEPHRAGPPRRGADHRSFVARCRAAPSSATRRAWKSSRCTSSAYIRPSPSSGTLGGVAEKTREAMLVCEAAGYDIVIVETVGVGQSEIAVAGMTDMFVLLQLPNAGDDLQAIKKGVMELADLVVINKADIDADAATRAQAQITSALRLFGQHGHPGSRAPCTHTAPSWHWHAPGDPAERLAGATASTRFWEAVAHFKTLQTANGRLAARRQHQALSWMWERIEAGLKQAFRQHPQVRSAAGRS